MRIIYSPGDGRIVCCPVADRMVISIGIKLSLFSRRYAIMGNKPSQGNVAEEMDNAVEEAGSTIENCQGYYT